MISKICFKIWPLLFSFLLLSFSYGQEMNIQNPKAKKVKERVKEKGKGKEDCDKKENPFLKAQREPTSVPIPPSTQQAPSSSGSHLKENSLASPQNPLAPTTKTEGCQLPKKF